jgi:diacylglycerol O-acyltransferase
LHNQQRLSPADAGLLALEARRGMPLHAGAVLLFDGPAPSLEELSERVRARLAWLPRYRSLVAEVPLRQGRPIWVADPDFALEHHVRGAALPAAAGEAELAALTGDLLGRPLERTRPLWELWLVENVSGGRFALIAKTHSALIEGGGDLLALALDGGEPQAARGVLPPAVPEAAPPPLQLLLETLAQRATSPREALATAHALAGRAREELRWRDLDLLDRVSGPPRSRLSARPGPGRSFAWVDAGLKGARRAKERLGGTLNDIVLTAVAGALGRYLREHGDDTDGLTLRALMPLAHPGTHGRLLASYAPLPVGIEDPRRRHAEISRALDGLRASGRARAAAQMLEADGHAPGAVIARAARLAVGQHAYNLAIANIPGPQQPMALLGRRLTAFYPALPLLRGQGLSVALVSYCGRLCFGLLADHDAITDLDLLASMLRESLRELPRAPAKRLA